MEFVEHHFRSAVTLPLAAELSETTLDWASRLSTLLLQPDTLPNSLADVATAVTTSVDVVVRLINTTELLYQIAGNIDVTTADDSTFLVSFCTSPRFFCLAGFLLMYLFHFCFL